MIDRSAKLISYIDRLPFDAVRTAWIARARAERSRLDALEKSLIANGLERVDCNDAMTPDGREVMLVRGRAYALRPDVHAKRRRLAIEAAMQRPDDPQTKSVVGTESLSAMVCPKCGDALQHTAVCQKCAAGKRGYRHRYTCVCGAIEIISQEAL